MQLFEEIKARVSMRDILEHYNIYPTRGTNIYRCPFHDDRRPSASIIKSCDKFHCFSCNWTGDIFDVVKHFEKCDHKTAMKIIDEKFGLGLLGRLNREQKLEMARQQAERDRQKQLIEKRKRELRHISITLRQDLSFWAWVESETEPRLRELFDHSWKRDDLYFQSLKEQERLLWLMDAITSKEIEPCEYSAIYGDTAEKIIEKLKKELIFDEQDFRRINSHADCWHYILSGNFGI